MQWYLPVPPSLNHNCHAFYNDSNKDHYRSDWRHMRIIAIWTDGPWKGELFWPSLTHPPPFEDEHRRTFAVFTLIPSLWMEYSPNTERLYSPSIPRGTHTSHGWVWATSTRGALNGKWVVGIMRVQSTFLWMSDHNCHNLFLCKVSEPMNWPHIAGGIHKGLGCRKSIHGHRTSKAPHPVRSAQLTGVPPS